MYCKRCESNEEYIYEQNGELVCRFCEEYHPNEDPSSEIIIDAEVENEVGDYIDHLRPIIFDLRDDKEKLDSEDVDYLMVIIRAKIEYHEGLITKEKYEEIINDTDL